MNTHPAVQQARSRRHASPIGIAVAVAFYLAVMAVTVPALRVPDHVDHLTIDNPHPWEATVEVTLTGFQLEQRGWRITVPDELADALRATHVPETPP